MFATPRVVNTPLCFQQLLEVLSMLEQKSLHHCGADGGGNEMMFNSNISSRVQPAGLGGVGGTRGLRLVGTAELLAEQHEIHKAAHTTETP